MMFSGRHGGEDQHLGRRLAELVHGTDAVYVHEPPFAWRPEKNLPWDEPDYSNVCSGQHEIVFGQVCGVQVHRCSRCPFYWVPDEILTNGLASMPFEGGRVWTRLEELDVSTPMAVREVFPFLSQHQVQPTHPSLRAIPANDIPRPVNAS
jgi:hypothetical protein